jgi:hypothetical protein
MTLLSSFALFIAGAWSCSSDFGGQQKTYVARWDYAPGNAWLRETDTWTGGGDVLMLTYVPQNRQWRAVITADDGSITVFEAPGTSTAHIAYRSAYPDATMTETFDRISTNKYATHFVQFVNKKTIRATDTCTRNTS